MKLHSFSTLFIWFAVMPVLFIANNSWPATKDELSEIEQEIISELDFYLQYDFLDNLDCIEWEILENSEYEEESIGY